MAMFNTKNTTSNTSIATNEKARSNEDSAFSINDNKATNQRNALFKTNNDTNQRKTQSKEKETAPLFSSKNKETSYVKPIKEKPNNTSNALFTKESAKRIKPKKTKFKKMVNKKPEVAKPFSPHKAKKTFLDETNIIRRTAEAQGGLYVLRDGSFMKFLQVNPKDILSRNNSEQVVDMGVMLNMLKTYNKDNKLISMNIPTDTEHQRMHLQRRHANTDNKMHKHFLEKDIEKLEFIEESSRMERSFLIMLFGESIKELQINLDVNRNALSQAFPTEKLTYETEKKILRKFNNQCEEIK